MFLFGKKKDGAQLVETQLSQDDGITQTKRPKFKIADDHGEQSVMSHFSNSDDENQ